jgi:hypothetical protein
VTSSLLVAVVSVVLVGAVLAVSAVLVGRVAEQFGEDPRWWQLRMLPLNVFGPFVAWMILSRRGSGGPRGFA